MPALTPTQRREFKARAHHIDPVVIIGDAGLTPAVLREIDVHLKSHELIKIRVFGDDRDARATMIGTICETLNASPVQHIGKTLVIFRPKPQKPAEPSGASGTPSKRKRPSRNAPRRTKRSYQG
jgi:putative YhbY family RNA-binding protein